MDTQERAEGLTEVSKLFRNRDHRYNDTKLVVCVPLNNSHLGSTHQRSWKQSSYTCSPSSARDPRMYQLWPQAFERWLACWNQTGLSSCWDHLGRLACQACLRSRHNRRQAYRIHSHRRAYRNHSHHQACRRHNHHSHQNESTCYLHKATSMLSRSRFRSRRMGLCPWLPLVSSTLQRSGLLCL